MGDAARSAFAVEIRERYLDIARDRWPVSVDPLPDELLSSWLHRLALANGIAPRSFAGALGFDERMWSPRLDLCLPRHVAKLLADQTGLAIEDISGMTTSGGAMAPLLLPLRDSAHRNRSTWMQYCPQCLAADDAPYFRREWRLASRVSCFAHGCGLRGRCPARHPANAISVVDLSADAVRPSALSPVRTPALLVSAGRPSGADPDVLSLANSSSGIV